MRAHDSPCTCVCLWRSVLLCVVLSTLESSTSVEYGALQLVAVRWISVMFYHRTKSYLWYLMVTVNHSVCAKSIIFDMWWWRSIIRSVLNRFDIMQAQGLFFFVCFCTWISDFVLDQCSVSSAKKVTSLIYDPTRHSFAARWISVTYLQSNISSLRCVIVKVRVVVHCVFVMSCAFGEYLYVCALQVCDTCRSLAMHSPLFLLHQYSFQSACIAADADRYDD